MSRYFDLLLGAGLSWHQTSSGRNFWHSGLERVPAFAVQQDAGKQAVERERLELPIGDVLGAHTYGATGPREVKASLEYGGQPAIALRNSACRHLDALPDLSLFPATADSIAQFLKSRFWCRAALRSALMDSLCRFPMSAFCHLEWCRRHVKAAGNIHARPEDDALTLNVREAKRSCTNL